MAEDNEQKAPLRSRTGTLLWPAPAAGDEPPGEPAAGETSEPDGPPSQRLMIGSLLNHIYKIERQIGRGGMAEVYEGASVLTDERVAIKVILQHLAEDPLMEAMFLREARTLIRLSHPALVQYRLAARDPILDILYLVTEFVDGPGLDEMMDGKPASLADTIGLMRRLAEGLGAAHRLGAIHRDLSPDNILLPNRRLEDATIIDFGIAKDLQSTSPTILGTGFAGKLKYVAPEQLGDFERSVGPWTDIYSLGLIMLAFSTGQDIPMGRSMIDAVDRRRAGVDNSIAPEPLRDLFAGMLQADPARRLRSREEVLRILNGLRDAAPATPIAPAAETKAPAWPPLETQPSIPPVAAESAPAPEPVSPEPAAPPSAASTSQPSVESTVFMPAGAVAAASAAPAPQDGGLGDLTEEDMWRRLRARPTTPPGGVGPDAAAQPVSRPAPIVDPALLDADTAEPVAPARGGFPLIGWVVIILGLIGALGAGALWAAGSLKLFAPRPTPSLATPSPVIAPMPAPAPVAAPPPIAVAPTPAAPVVPPPSALPSSPTIAPPVVSASPPVTAEASAAPAKHHRKPATSGAVTYKRVITPDKGPSTRAPASTYAPSPSSNAAPPAASQPAKKPGFLHRLILGSGKPKPEAGSGEGAPQNKPWIVAANADLRSAGAS